VKGDFVFTTKLNLLKRRLIWWRKNVFNSLYKKKKRILAQIDSIDREIEGGEFF